MPKVSSDVAQVNVGWAQADITPSESVALAGQFFLRPSEGVLDPVTATAWAVDDGNDHFVFVSCEVVSVPNAFRDDIRAQLQGRADGLDPRKVIMHATHTHTAPTLPRQTARDHVAAELGVQTMPPAQYAKWASARIADAVVKAWESRSPARLAFGMDNAVVGRNRRWVNLDGVSTMYGNTDTETFSHIEGYEDHSIGVIASRDHNGKLVGLVVNIVCPSQETETLYQISADYWCETRKELRKRFGEDLFVLPQLSAAGDQSPHLIYDKKAHNRMLELAGRTQRQEIGLRIADAVERALKTLGDHVDSPMPMRHHVEVVDLEMNRLTKEQTQQALADADDWRKKYEEEMQKIEADPSLRDQPRWFHDASYFLGRMYWCQGVGKRYDQQESGELKPYPCELHVIRMGDIAFATNPFEYYLDYGVYIKARSKAVQTFLVQLAGQGTYVPSLRSTQGGGYGSVPASNPVGPKGGRVLADRTIEVINGLWE